MVEPKPSQTPEPVQFETDAWGLPVAITRMDEPDDLELGVECVEDPDQAW